MKKIISIILIIIFFIFIIHLFPINEKFNSNDGIYTAVIIEPRKHKALEFVLTNFTSMLDNRWKFIIFHGNRNINYINKIINEKLINDRNRIQLINLNVDNLTIHDYNSLLYDPKFYDNINTEIFLIFQTDTMICSKYKDNIYNFLNYDYVGAPQWEGENVGNGGLSLRRKSKMLEIIDKCIDRKMYSPNQLHNEDSFFSNICIDKVKINKPSFNEAKEFAIEGVYSDKSFGIHKLWGYHDYEKIKNINNFCPNLNTLIELNQ